MDFLRIEGEGSFLALLPSESRQDIKSHWYRDATLSLINFLQRNKQGFEQEKKPVLNILLTIHKKSCIKKYKKHKICIKYAI